MKYTMQVAQDHDECFNPPSIVPTIVNVIEPDHSIVPDPAAGSGGMFVQFVECRVVSRSSGSPSRFARAYAALAEADMICSHMVSEIPARRARVNILQTQKSNRDYSLV